MSIPYRFAVCNELWGKTDFSAVCKQVREIGYEGIEIAPFTLAERPADISEQRRRELSNIITGEGLAFVGLHWLLVSPEGLHATTSDTALRKRTWEHVHELVDLCADLAGSKVEENGVMVFGSPKQRSTVNGMTPREAVGIFTSEVANLAAHAESRGVKILIEPLSASQTNVINCLHDAAAIVKQIGSPAIRTMFDTHNAVDETEPHSELLRKYCSYIAHIHVNEKNGSEPGSGSYDFAALLAALTDLDYSGFVSFEGFEPGPDPSETARRALTYLKSCVPAAERVS